MPLKFNNKLISIDLPTYNVTVLPSSNGSVTATPSSGVPGTIVSLSNTPDPGYTLQEYQLTGSSLIDTDKFMIKKSDVSVHALFRSILPPDMDFLYQAKDFDGEKMPNTVPNSSYGPYRSSGDIVLNGSGENAYISNGLIRTNYLYLDLSNDQLNAMKAVTNTYTYFIRVQQTTMNKLGAIVSFRRSYDSGYIYMIRAYNGQLQIHTNTGYNCGNQFKLTSDTVYKVTIRGSSFVAKNLNNESTYSLTYSTNRSMGTQMTSFDGYNAPDAQTYPEGFLDRFYAIAGIPRDTTAEEDEMMKNCLLSQSV